MAIQVGETLPTDITLREMRDGAITSVTLGDLVRGRRVVMFAVLGAFSPDCQAQLPGYIDQADAITAKGIDEIICVAVNDPFVLDAWGSQLRAAGRVRIVSDGNADLARAVGLELDVRVIGMGTRSQRYAMIVDDGRVEQLLVETEPVLDRSRAEAVLREL